MTPVLPSVARRFALPIALVAALAAAVPANSADDPVGAAMKLFAKRRYEQAARVLEDALGRLDTERRAPAQLALGIVYLRNADLHEALARTAAAAELDYLGKLTKTGSEGRSRYARLYLAEAQLARGNAREAGPQFARARTDAGIRSGERALAGIGLGSVAWSRGDAARARSLWSGAGSAPEIALARAAAEARARAADPKSLIGMADDAARARELAPRARRYLIEIYLAARAPAKALALVRGGDLGAPSYVEHFKAARGTAKSIAFYDLALLGDLAQLYRQLAKASFEQAATDARVKPTAEYYLAETLDGLGEDDAALAAAESFIAQPQAPAQYRERARARRALIAYRKGRRAESESAWTAMAEATSDPEVLSDIVLACADAQAACPRVITRAATVTEAGEARRAVRLNFALGRYYLFRRDYARAIDRMEAGRDKSNKNKIEANDPEMLAGLAEAYYRTKQFSESLEIFFEMSGEFPAVRQIQEAVQGVYSMEQRSAGDVRIL